MLVPVIPLPMMTTSAVLGKGQRYDANVWGGICQYERVGDGTGRLMTEPEDDLHDSEARLPEKYYRILATTALHGLMGRSQFAGL
jgi:hypothetical protein